LLDDPVNRTLAPLDVDTEPVMVTPAPASVAGPVQEMNVVVPAVRVVEVDGATKVVVPTYVMPPKVIWQDCATVFEVPVLIMERSQISWTANEQLVTLAVTVAVFVNVPNRPKTKPAIAIAAMRVMAIRITVANTGEIAFLLQVRVEIFMICRSLWEGSAEGDTAAVGGSYRP